LDGRNETFQPKTENQETKMNSTVKHTMMALALTPAALAQNTVQNAVYQSPAPVTGKDLIVRIIPVQSNAHESLPQSAGPVMYMVVNRQESAGQDAPVQTPVPPQVMVAPPQPAMVLRDGTPVRLRLTRTLSSAHVKTGDEIDFDVLDDVTLAGQVIIPRSSKAIGVITDAEHKKWAGRGGKLNLALQYVRLDDGTKVNLRAESDNKGGGHVAAMTAGMVATVALSFGAAAPLFLFVHGKDAVVPAGTELTAFVDGDTRLALSAVASPII
jgi:hypothetical protein